MRMQAQIFLPVILNSLACNSEPFDKPSSSGGNESHDSEEGATGPTAPIEVVTTRSTEGTDSTVRLQRIRDVHALYVYRIPAATVRELAFTGEQVQYFEELVSNQREGTLEWMEERVRLLCMEYGCIGDDEVYLHKYLLEWEGDNISARLRFHRRAISAQELGATLDLNNNLLVEKCMGGTSPGVGESMRRSFERSFE